MNVIITGASSGIGAALARCYAHRGAVLGLIARRRRELERLAETLGTTVSICAADVRDTAVLSDFAAQFVTQHGCPDIVIANAGVSVGTLTARAEDSPVFREVMDINVAGVVHTLQPFIAPMRERRQGTLVGIASVAGLRGLPGASAYSASKAALISYLESLRVELHGSGVRVVTICPGYIATPMTEKNSYPMPFIISANAAARKIISLIARGKTYAVIPWQMAWVARLLRLLPNWLYDRLFAKAPRKQAQ